MTHDRLLELGRYDTLARKARRRGDAAGAARWHRAGILLLQLEKLQDAKRDDIARRLGELLERRAAEGKQRARDRNPFFWMPAAREAGWLPREERSHGPG